MHPIIYQYSVFGHQRLVAGYGLMVALGILAGLGTVVLLAWRRRLDVINVVLVALIAVGAGLIGSYLLFLITILPDAIRDPSALLQGGLVFYGGPIAAVPAAWLACKRLEVPPMKMADLAAVGLPLGHAFGRFGCFLGGCCFGGRSDGPLAVVFTHPLSPAAHPSIPRHPVQLYEAAALLLISLTTHLLWRRTTANGQVALLYVMAYALWRFVVEFFRDDAVRGHLIPGVLSTSQAISLLLIPAAIYGWVRLHRLSARSPLPSERGP